MSKYYMIIAIFILLNSSSISRDLDRPEPNNCDSLKTVNTNLKTEIKTLKKRDFVEKVVLLIIGATFTFIFTQIVKRNEKKSQKKNDLISALKLFIDHITNINNEYNNIPAKLYKPPKPTKLTEYSSFFADIRNYYSDPSKFSIGENNSSTLINIRDFFTKETLDTLLSHSSESISLYNSLYKNKIDENVDTVYEIINKIKQKTNYET